MTLRDRQTPVTAVRFLVAVALVCATAPVAAEPFLRAALNRQVDLSRWTDNYVELGIGRSSERSFKFGEFNGLSERGAFPIAGFNWRSAARDNDARYLHAYGANLGLDSRKLALAGGEQGRWRLSFSADRLVRAETETARFIHLGLGSDTLVLPAGFAGISAGNAQPSHPGNAAIINAALRPFAIEQGRDIYRLGTALSLARDWDLRIDYREDRREGNRLTGAAFGTNGGNPRSVVVPYPIDDRTRQIEALLSWATQRAQFQLGYSYSRFDNELTALTWQNPYASVSNWPPGNVAVGTLGRLSLMPSNDHQQLTATGGYSITRRARLTAQVSYGVARQNEAFLPYTANTAIATPSALPRGSLDGKVVNTLADVALTAQPLDRMSLKLGYQYRESDNRTPAAQYRYVALDTDNQPAANNTARSRTNVPISSREHKFVADADYELFERTRLRASLERRQVDYTNADVRESTTDKTALELRRSVSASFTGALGVAHQRRRGERYDKNQFFRASYDPAFQAATPFDNNPQMRQFLYADYDEDRVRASGSWVASETVSVQGSVDWNKRHYRGSNCAEPGVPASATLTWSDDCLGRKASDGVTANVDLQWQPDEEVTGFAFYTYQQSSVDQLGRSWNNVAAADDTNADFTVSSDFRDHSLGLGLRWQPSPLWDLGGQYQYARGRGDTALTRGPALGGAFAPVPSLTSTLHGLQLWGKWQVNKRTTLRLNYAFERLRSFDWAYADALPTSSNNVLLTGQGAPRYDSHILGGSVAFTHW